MQMPWDRRKKGCLRETGKSPLLQKRKTEREVGNEAKEVVRQAGNIEPRSS